MKNILIAVLVIFAISCEAPQLEYYVPVEITYAGYQLEMKHEINADRITHGLDVLIAENKLTEICRDYAITMDDTRVYNHRFFLDRWVESEAEHFGEVIAINYLTAQSNMAAFKNSAPHINVLRNPIYKRIGIYRINNCVVIELASYYTN